MADFDVFARYYDLDYGDFLDDLPLYLGFAERMGSPILELACGTGRLLLTLAEAGYSMTGIDSSAAMLAAVNGKLAGPVKRRVKVFRYDMADFALGRQFKMVTIPVGGLMLAPHLEEQAAVLRRAREHLADEGLLVVDIFNPDVEEMARSAGQLIHAWTKPAENGATVSKFVSQTPDFADQLQHITFFYDETQPGGETRRTVASFTQRYLFRFEAELLLEKCGFQLENVFGSYDLDDFESDSENMIFVARRSA
ncbi:MAG: class I SAM-dependent methyltransferase [Chloroflexi bacterium]|nr:class I SAM-dependent methyltransferase [Chloroflexota bacterium]